MSASHTLNLKKALIILSFFIGALLLAPAASAANCGGSVACSCGDSLNESRTLNASDNLTGCTGNGLNIIVTNVVLDCDGYPISGDNTGTNIGISIGTGLGNFTVRNCTITNFSGASERGIHAISRGVIEYNTITNCTYGIVADQGATSFSGTVRGNTISGGGSSGAGIYIASVNPTNITENTIYSNYNGLYISYYDTVNKIWRNNIYNNTNKNAFVSSATYMPFELSFNNEGNYWGHTCPSVFTAGTDSNAATVNDSYPYDIFNGWLTGSPADCVVPSATITAPSSGTTLPRTNYSITGTASDNVGIANVYVIITGSGTYTASYNGSTNAWSYTWDTSTEADGFYNITINASDAKGNYNDTSTATNIEIDKTPIISGVAAVSITSSGATITWTTDENANSTVDYGTTTALGSTSSNPSYVTSHSISLSSLSASTLYHYNVTSCDQTGNCQTEGTYNFTTSSIPAPVSRGGGDGGEPEDIGTVTDKDILASLSKYREYSFDVDDDSHTLDVDSIDYFNRRATFTVSSSPITFTLSEGESRTFDFDDDGNIDLEFVLNRIVTSNHVDITLKQFEPVISPAIEVPEEPVIEPEEVEEEPVEAPAPEIISVPEKPSKWPYILAGVVILLVIFAAFQLKEPRTRRKYWRAIESAWQKLR